MVALRLSLAALLPITTLACLNRGEQLVGTRIGAFDAGRTDTGGLDAGMARSPGPDGSSAEVCGNGLDDDGNRLVDERCPCAEGQSQRCWPLHPGLRNVGACADGRQRCRVFSEFPSWGACEGVVLPTAEVPGNGIDEDCDGDAAGSTTCAMRETAATCENSRDDDCDGASDCDDTDCRARPACSSTCTVRERLADCGDGRDNDCDGATDCFDEDCDAAEACIVEPPVCVPTFFVEWPCEGGVDDDCDDLIDCDDPDCRMPGLCGCASHEYICFGETDDDCDGRTDCADEDCETCVVDTLRFCPVESTLAWGQQTCLTGGHWGPCEETPTVPPSCAVSRYSVTCCVDAGACCTRGVTDPSGYDGTSIGACSGIAMCME